MSEPLLLRDPTVSRTHVAFSYGGYIWIASRSGEGLRRLTSDGYESLPALSPNGAQVAFVGEYAGPRGVFVLPIEGGVPRRLTYHPDDLGVIGCRDTGNAVGWTPDGKYILFSSRREASVGAPVSGTQLYLVPVEGGAVTRLPLTRAAQGAFSPDSKRIAYVPNTKLQPEWKRYRGGETTPIWVADLMSSGVETTVPRDNSNDFNPMWVGDQIYFLSDRNGPVTLFACDLKAMKVREVVKNDSFDIKSASACGDTIIYDQFGSLHLLDLRSGQDRVLDTRPIADFPELRPRYKSVADIIGSASPFPAIKPKISPNGASAAFAVRGEILTISANGDFRNLTRTPGAVERDPAWSPDGRFIAYFSDESGEYALHVREVSTQIDAEAVRRFELGSPPSFYYSPTWSPDGKKIAYLDKRLNYWYLDLDSKKSTLIDTDVSVDPPRVHAINSPVHMVWAPDSRWIAYTKVLENQLHALFVHAIEQGRSYRVTDGMSDVLHVAFDQRGERLYFTASTGVGLGGDWMAMSHMDRYRLVKRGVYELALSTAESTPLASRGGDGTDLLTRYEGEPVEVDLKDVSMRIARLPVVERQYGGIFAGAPGSLFLVEEVETATWLDRRRQNIHRFECATGKSELILEDVLYFDLSRNADRMLYATCDGIQRRRWWIAPTRGPIAPAGESQAGELRLEAMQIYIDPRSEWRHIYDQAWRHYRDFCYDPGLHGLDLEKMKEKYAPFVENIVCRADLTYLLAETLANVTLGHVWVDDGVGAERKRAKTGLLGADYRVEQGRYQFVRIYEADPWNNAARAPLRQPGMSVRAGEYLLSVDGRDVWPSADIFSYFEETAGKKIVLRVGPEANGAGAREVTVVPINDEYPLRYFAWVEGNRAKVDTLTCGRVAYVHLPNCMPAGFAAFNRYFFAQVGKDAVIVDARYNTGGQLPDYIIDCLSRSPWCYWYLPHGPSRPAPVQTIFGPKVMLMNEMNFSMGEVLPWSFRKARLGPLIGRRTCGGSVGFYEKPGDILDHGLVAAPNLAFYTPDGAWEIENAGVVPDIEVEDDPKAARAGGDAQLEKGIEVVMDLLRASPPPKTPQRPPFPNYQLKS